MGNGIKKKNSPGDFYAEKQELPYCMDYIDNTDFCK